MPKPQRLALYGGSFDPVHNGHLQVARTARDTFDLDRVLFIPCRQSPHKNQGPVANEEERLEMLHLATEGIPWAAVSEIEMLLPPPSFSWITAEAMREVYPEARLFWLMGADQWAVIQSWARPDHLANLVEFIVHERQGTISPPVPGFRVHHIQGDHPASASKIRASPEESRPFHWLPPKVEQFIRSRGLYSCRA